jgi:hypothetical protein
MVAIGLDEIASFDAQDSDERRFYVATAAGLYVATFKPRKDMRDDPKLDAELLAWADVRGARWFAAGFVDDGLSLTVKIDHPEFDHSATRNREIRALAQFGIECMNRQGGRGPSPSVDPSRP